MPTDKALFDYYNSISSISHGSKPRSTIGAAFFSAIAKLRINHINKYLESQTTNVLSVLEFGPGPGFLAKAWLRQKPETNYYACESDASCHDSLASLGVIIIANDELSKINSAIDLVVLSHVLEHASDPIEFLRHATQKLRTGGVLFIEVPCNDFEHKDIDEPHVLFFNKEPMLYLLKKLGFEEVQVSYHGEDLKTLRSKSILRRYRAKIRDRLIMLGIVRPFSKITSGLENDLTPIEIAVVKPFLAHRESNERSWWLRAVAIKS